MTAPANFSITGNYYMASMTFDARQSKRRDIPVWLRIAHYARAHQGVNSWCSEQAPDDLAEAVGVLKTNLPRAIRSAVDYGYLREGSTSSRLLLSSYEIHRKAASGR